MRYLPAIASALSLAVLAGSSADATGSAKASPYRTCRPVRVDLGAISASVRARNTSCQFARGFVRRHRASLCDPSRDTIAGWRKSFAGPGENITLTLSKGSKRIKTDACGS